MKDILAKLSQLEASSPAPQKKKVLKESSLAKAPAKPATLKDLFYKLDEAIASGQKPVPVMDPANKKAGMGFVTSNNPAVQNMLKNLDPKDVQIVQAPGTQPGQPTQQQTTQQSQQQTQQKSLQPIQASNQPNQTMQEEELDEISKSKLQKYDSAARNSIDDLRWKSYGEYGGPDEPWEKTPDSEKATKKHASREKMLALAKAKKNKSGTTAPHYTPKATAKVRATNEEQLDELSPELLYRAAGSAWNKTRALDPNASLDPKQPPQPPGAQFWKKKTQKFINAGEKAKVRDVNKANYEKQMQGMSPAQRRQYEAMLKSGQIAEEQLDERDEGKPGKNFAKIAKSAGKRYGSKEAGERVAGAVRAKLSKQGKLEEEHTGDEAEKKFNKYNAQELDHMLDRAYGRSKPGDAHKQKRAGQAKNAAYNIMWNKKYSDLEEADIAPTAGIDTKGAGLGAGRSPTRLEGKKTKPDFLDLDKDGNKKETMKKAAADKNKKPIKEGLAERIRAAHHQGKAHGLNGVTHSGKNYEDMEECRAYHEGYKEGLDECHGMTPIAGLHTPHMPATVHGMADQALDEGRGSRDLVMNAIRHRILNSHIDLVGKFGPGKIMAAIEDQAGHYDSVDLEEIGSSDVSIWVNNVIRDLESGHYDYVDESEMDEGNAFTGALAKTPRGGHFKVGGKTFTDTSSLDESDYAFEAWDRQLENLINEGLSVSISKDNANAPDSVSVNATDQEADKLLALVRQAGMGIFGGEDGAEMSNAPVIGGASEINAPGEIEVVDDHDGMMNLIKRMSGIGGGDHQEDYDDGDYADEESYDDHEETCNECGMMESQCGCNEEVLDEVESEDQMEYEVAEGQAQAPQGAQNPPDNGSANSSNDTQGNAAANSALATADQTDQPEMAESKECTECNCDPCECDDEDDWHDKDGNVDANGAHDAGGHYHREREMDESFSFQNLYKKFAMLEAKTEKEDEKAEKAGKKVAKDIEYDEGHKGKDDDKAEKAGKKVTKDIEYDDKKAKKLDEWANDAGPGKTVSDTTFEQDIDFMTKVISGGLNKQKSTGQTTVPIIASEKDRMRSYNTTDINESLNDWKKLAGL